MESIKIRYFGIFNKKDKSKTSETGNCQNGNDANISRLIASVEQTTKKGNLRQLWPYNRRGHFSSFFVSKI